MRAKPWEVSDGLWKRIEPLLPKRQRRFRYAGRRPLDDRRVLQRTLIADRGYDHDKYRRLVWQRGVKPIIGAARPSTASGLGKQRWVVERTFAWLHNRRRLLILSDRRDDIHEAVLALACCLICWRRLESALS
jgi:transposase